MLRQDLIELMMNLLREVLTEAGSDQVVEVAPTVPLVGPRAVVDSLDLVSFIAAIEETFSDSYGLEVALVTEAALSRRNSPFRTIETLADYVQELIGAAPAPDVPISAEPASQLGR